MQVLGVLVRTRNDPVTELGFSYADDILRVSHQHGHIFIDIAAEMATRENVLRVIDGIGRPKGSFLKLIVFYCHGSTNSPIDQNGHDIITDETLSKFADWGVYCIGCDIGQTLGHRLLAMGARFLIAFNAPTMVVLPHADEIYAGLNSGVLAILREGIDPSTATEYMREFFLKSFDHVDKSPSEYSMMRKVALRSHAKSLVYYGPDIQFEPSKTKIDRKETMTAERNVISELREIMPGHRNAAKYQQYVAKILHGLFSPHLDEPHFEVSNESGSSRYDIVFWNRAERGFWHDIKVSRGNSIVLFDAKNKKELVPSDADQMLRYSGDWRGHVIFIVCREKPSRSFVTRMADLLKEKGVCLIVVSDGELEEMQILKHQGEDPTTVIERLFRERIEGA